MSRRLWPLHSSCTDCYCFVCSYCRSVLLLLPLSVGHSCKRESSWQLLSISTKWSFVTHHFSSHSRGIVLPCRLENVFELWLWWVGDFICNRFQFFKCGVFQELQCTLGQKSTFYPKILKLKIPIVTKFTFLKPHFSQNSHFWNHIFHKIHNSDI